jgi:hypothetical protein
MMPSRKRRHGTKETAFDMRNLWRALGPLLLPLAGIGISVIPRTSGADEVAPPRVTIRGTGNSISIERSVAGAPRFLAPAAPRSPVLAQAADMKEAGTTDAALVGYLKAHSGELPNLIDFETVSRLQSAGAGRTVIAYLTTVSAVEIGPTGAVGGAHEESVEEAPASAEPYMSNELPIWYGGYGGFVGDGSGRRMRPGHGVGHHGGIGIHGSHGTGRGMPAFQGTAGGVPAARGGHVVSTRAMTPGMNPQPRFSHR